MKRKCANGAELENLPKVNGKQLMKACGGKMKKACGGKMTTKKKC